MRSCLRVITIGILIFPFSALRADELKNNFQANIDQTSLNALANDIGAVMGGGSFHEGKALGFPLGFDVGVHVPVVGIQSDNKILKDDVSTVQALWGQAEVGLPGRINVIGRVGKLYDANLIGGGLRVGLLTPSVPAVPALSVSALYSKLKHDFIDLSTLSVNAVVSIDLPFIHPYVGVGYDRTKLEPTAAAFVIVPASVSRNLEGKADGYRAEAGINLSIIPFTYLTLGGGLANGRKMVHAGAGVRF